MSSNAVGEIPILVTADLSELSDAVQQAERIASAGAQEIASAFSLPNFGQDVADGIRSVGDAANTAAGQLSLFGEEGSAALQEVTSQLSLFDVNGIEATDAAFGSLAVSAEDAVAPLEEAAHAEQDNTHALEELGTGLAEVGKGLLAAGVAAKELTEFFSEIASESVNLTGKIQFSETALNTFFGSAEKTEEVLSTLKGIEESSIFDYPDLVTAAQHLAAMGLNAEETAQAMSAAAVSAEAVGGSAASIDTATNALARIASTGQISNRALLALGLSWDDIAKQMGLSAARAKEELENNIGDASQRLTILTGAMHAKFDQLGEDLQTSLPVALNKLRNEWDNVLEELGKTLVPIAIEVAGALRPILSSLSTAAEYFGSLPAPVQYFALALGALATAAGPVAIGLGAIFFAIGELTEGVPRVMEAIAELTAQEEGGTVAAGEYAAASEAAATALRAEGVAATTAAGEVAATGTAAGTATGLMSGFGAAASAAAAVLAGFHFGWFAGGLKDASQQLQEMSAYAHSLGVNLDQTSASADGLGNAVKKLQDVAEQHKVDIGKLTEEYKAGTLSIQQYALALLQAIKGHKDAAETAVTVSKSIQSITDEASKNASAVKNLQQAVQQLNESYRTGKPLLDGHVATLAEVELAERKLKAALEAVNPPLKEQATHAKAVDTTWATVPDHATAVAIAMGKITSAVTEQNSKLQLSIEVYAKMKTDGVSSAEAIAAAYKDVEKEANALGISHSKLATSITEAVAAASGANAVWVNGKEVLVGLDGALKLAGETAKQVVVPAFGDANSAGKDLTETITVLTGSANTQAAAVEDTTNQWVNLDGTLTRLSDILTSLQAPLSSLTNETDAAATAADAAAAAYDRMASSASKASKSGGGGDQFGSLAGKSVSAAEMLALGLTTPFGIGSYITGGEQYQMAQELANMTGQTVQTNQGTFYPVVNGKSINPETGEPFAGQTPLTPSSSPASTSSSPSSPAAAATGTATAVQNLSTQLNTAATAADSLASASADVAKKIVEATNAYTDFTSVTTDTTTGVSDLSKQIESLMGTLHVTNQDWQKANDLLMQASNSGDVVAEQLAYILRNQATGNALLIEQANQASGAVSNLAQQIEGLFGTLRVNQDDWNKANDLLKQAFAANDTVAEQLAYGLRNQATGNALTGTFSTPTVNLGIPAGGTVLNPVSQAPTITVQLNNATIYGQGGAQMVGQELTNALRTIASQKLF